MPSTATVTFASEAGQMKGHLARPGKGVPGLIVLQEWWGLVPHIKDVAGRFAAQGYLALAPDLYHGKSTLEAAEAEHLMKGLDWALAAKEIAGAVKYLREVEGATHVGVTGLLHGRCFDVIAATQPGVDAYVAFYGFPPAGPRRVGEDRGARSHPLRRRRSPTSPSRTPGPLPKRQRSVVERSR